MSTQESAADAGITFESTSETVEADGFTFHFHDVGPLEDGQPEGAGDADGNNPYDTTILLLHGSGPGVTAWSNFGGNIPALARRFRVIALDMPGFGLSSDHEWDRGYPLVAADAIDAFLDELGVDEVDIIGNSMGGNVACELAISHPGRVRRLALMGPGGLAAPLFSPEPSEGSRRLFDFLSNPSDEAMAAWVDTMVGNKKVVSPELIRQRTEAATAPGAVERMYSIFGSILDPAKEYPPLYARASKIRQETMLIWGRDDRMLPYEQAHFAFRQLPNAELHAFSKCGHWAMIEQKEKFERLVTEFFTR
ncbi:alpha/beta fold hydrolase [Dietzia sp.]|uniref:alpha/beta fold hydrolase n=1 Tax=Dietzia sp. TaxID=1871616 RepID=UPI002FDAD0FD